MQVRLCGIDAPQLQHGKTSGQAREKLRSLVAASENKVMVIPVETDSDARTVAEVMTTGKDGIEVSFIEEMLKSGMAYYRKSASICPNHLAFENAEKLAIASNKGVWSQSR